MNISEAEWKQFRSVPAKEKIDCMETYLIGVPGRRYNMKEVASLVYGNENYGFKVSMIHRCYNFNGQNGSKYRNGCKFEQTYGYRVTRKDIEAFVRKYPDGTFNKGITFEDFLLTRIKEPGKTYSEASSVQAEEQPPNDRMRFILIGIGSIGILIILLIFASGGFLKHWKACILLALFIIGVFSIAREI